MSDGEGEKPTEGEEPTTSPSPSPSTTTSPSTLTSPDTSSDAAADTSSDAAAEVEPLTLTVEGAEVSGEVVEGEAPAEAPVDPLSSRLPSIVESMLFAADKPLSLQMLGALLGAQDLGPVRAAVAAIEEHYATRGVQLHSVAGGYQFRTNPENAVWVQKLLAQKPVRLTRAQLETLAICAYRQPITRPEIEDIRGVDSGGSVKSLIDRSLVRILGKREEPGRPLLFGTTREFLDFFSLGDLKDLPTLREFHELSEEHRAQVAALEEKAPAGSVETEEEAAAAEASRVPLQRVTLETPPEDTAELEEIDRLITSAGGGAPLVLDPNAEPTGEATPKKGKGAAKEAASDESKE